MTGSKHVMAETGCTYRQLTYWISSGLLSLDNSTAAIGCGNRWEFTDHDISKVRALTIVSAALNFAPGRRRGGADLAVFAAHIDAASFEDLGGLFEMRLSDALTTVVDLRAAV